MHASPKPTVLIAILVMLHSLLGISATVGGVLMMVRPDGSLLQMDCHFLDGSPFRTFLIPGNLLILLVGIPSLSSLIGLTGLGTPPLSHRLNLYQDRHWAWAFSVYTGITTILWITFQLLLTSFFWLQPVIILVAVAILILTLTPAVMEHFRTDQ
ncbi:MAG: hypothetical protein K9I85_11990 [Saprospiraceae bacterium]|nr:hypothetical protein [Saprospiraceae bacterium]